MSEIPAHLKYTKDHEWIAEADDGTVIVGITDHAQEALGDLVFVELPEMHGEVQSEDVCAVVESVKAASDVFSPWPAKLPKSTPPLTMHRNSLTRIPTARAGCSG